ncbi:MAG TPA: methyltransferase domain-containing protein [Acidimicrobiales bacterium]
MPEGPESRLEFYRRWHRLARPYFAWQFRQFARYVGRRVADVGCGVGNFQPFLQDRDLYLGVDPDKDLTDELLKEYGSSAAVEVLNADVTARETVEGLRARRIDSILCVNVIEHIDDDRAAVANMVEALPSGGHLCLLVPAGPWLFGSLDEADGHHRRYSKQQWRVTLGREPVDVLTVYYFNALGALGWFVKGRILREPRHADANFGGMNLLVPLLSRLEAAWPPPFGLSLIAVLRRR